MNKLNQKLVYIESDNFVGYMTERAYRELTLQMSTGDYGVHKHSELQLLACTDSEIPYHDIDEETGKFLEFIA